MIFECNFVNHPLLYIFISNFELGWINFLSKAWFRFKENTMKIPSGAFFTLSASDSNLPANLSSENIPISSVFERNTSRLNITATPSKTGMLVRMIKSRKESRRIGWLNKNVPLSHNKFFWDTRYFIIKRWLTFVQH